MRKNSIKNTRINEEVLRKLSEIIHGSIKDPRINPMTSIVSVQVAPDLKTCKAYVSVLGDEQSQKDTLAGLKSAEGYIRRSLAQSANLRHTPQIAFIIDQSIEYGVNMSHLIDKVNRKGQDMSCLDDGDAQEAEGHGISHLDGGEGREAEGHGISHLDDRESQEAKGQDMPHPDDGANQEEGQDRLHLDDGMVRGEGRHE